MNSVRAILRREFGSFFHSAMAPVVLTVFLVLCGFFFTQILFSYGDTSLASMRSGKAAVAALNISDGIFKPLSVNMTLFLVFVLPAVTMRLFSEEFRSGRYDLVMTYPVSEQKWVLGKFLSVWGVGGAIILSSWFFFGIAAVLGRPEAGPFFAVQLGLMMVTAAFCAWGVFFSTLVQYQVVSYILAFGFSLLIYMVGVLEPYLPGVLGRAVEHIAVPAHFVRFSRGVIDSRDIVYFVLLTALGVSAATASLSGRRLAGARRWARWAPTLILAVIAVVLSILAARYPLTADWTSNRRYSLAPQTEQVLGSLDTDVEVRAYYQRLDPNRRRAEVLLGAFADHCPEFRYRVLDPDRDLVQVRDDGVTTVRSMVVEAAGRRIDLLDPDESTLVNAVYRAVLGEEPVVYYMVGHGEPAIDDESRSGFVVFADALAQQGYHLRPLISPDEPEVPSDADLVVLAAPQRDPSAAEMAALDDYLARGGSMLAMLDPGTPAAVESWLAQFNIAPGNDMIVSRSGTSARFGVDDRVLVLFEYGRHEITRGLDGLATFFPFAQSLRPLSAAKVGLSARTLLMTGERSWAETDLAALARGEMEFDEGADVLGPIPFGVAVNIDRGAFYGGSAGKSATVEQESELPDDPALRMITDAHTPRTGLPPSVFDVSRDSRLVIVGDAGFAANENINLYGNRDLLLNMASWLAREKLLIAPRARSVVSEPLVLGPAQRRFLGWGCVLGWPLLVGAAVAVFVLRRRRHG